MQFFILLVISSLALTLAFRHNPRQLPTTSPLPSASPPAPIPAAAILQQNAQCQLVSTALSICGSLTPGFNTLQPSKQAQCLCYAETTFVPGGFNDAVQTCAEFASTAVPGAYGAIHELEGFCERNGEDSTCCGVTLTTTNMTMNQTPAVASTSLSAASNNPSIYSAISISSTYIPRITIPPAPETSSRAQITSHISLDGTIPMPAPSATIVNNGGRRVTSKPPQVVLISAMCAAAVLFLC